MLTHKKLQAVESTWQDLEIEKAASSELADIV
jgi:hypothetical protein